MSTRKHEIAVELAAAPEEVFKLLHTPSDIRGWWSAARAIVLAQPGGVWMAAWGSDEDDADYITAARIEVFEPPRRMVLGDYQYHSRSGPLPFAADFTTEFRVSPTENGSLLQVAQDGFPAGPEADEFYAACEKGWHDTLDSMRRYLEARKE
jgi:uncharacterized protein YndB with AHSA1/START domain